MPDSRKDPTDALPPIARHAFNAGIDRATKIVSEWLDDGRDPVELLDKLADAKMWGQT